MVFGVPAEGEEKVTVGLLTRVEKFGACARKADEVGVDVSGECLAVASVFLEEDGVLGNAVEFADFANGVNWWSFGVVPSNRQGGFGHILLGKGSGAGER